MIGDYTVLEKSMNGVKTLSDGISIISDGVATHENVYYTEFIKSEDEKTILLNDTITTENIYVNHLNALDIASDEVSTGVLSCDYLYVNDVNNPLQDVLEVDGNLKKFKLFGQGEFRDVLNIINTNVSQTQGGTIQQTGTNFNTFKDTKVNGFLEVGSNITQNGGSTSLKDVSCDNITMNTNKGIAQSGTGVSNTLGTSTITNLTITGSVTFPSNVTIPGTTTSDDIVMNGSSVITQDTTVTTTKFNKFRYTKTLNLDIDGDISQTKASATATLKNTIIQGTSTLQGDVEQTAGFTKLNTIECNNITLRLNNDINLSGTGKITQIGTGINQLNAITLNNNQNITFNGSGIISQALSGTNILSHFRTAGFGIVGGRNNTSFSHTQNIQNNNGLQFQYNRDNSTFYSYLMNNRVGAGGGFRFQRYNGGVHVDEPLVIDDNITMNKDLNIVGKSISASSATLGIISQDELNCLDNCNLNIITKFNILDNQIASLQTTASGVSNNTTGITYNINNDTTTVDNNLLIPSGKSLTLGSTNVNSFITDTNTFINAATNTLQGIVYTSGNDTTTINNNLSITGNLLVQGMNIKAEIDALETSFTTGTLTSTDLTTGTLNVSNQINMTNPTRQFRNINNVGYLNFCDVSAPTDINSLSVGISGNNAYYNNVRPFGHHQFLGKDSDGVDNGNRLIVLPDANNGNYNPTTTEDDVVVFGAGSTANTQSLNLTVWSNTGTGVRIEPTRTTITGGTNNIQVSSTGTNINGNNGNINITSNNNNKVIINNYDYNEETSKVSNIQYANGTYTISSSPPSAGNNNILGVTITVNPRFKKKISFLIPFSLTRNFRVNADLIQWAQVVESFRVSVNVHKNDVSHSTFNSLNTLTNTISLFTNQPSSFLYTYNYYCGSLAFEFTPDYNPNSSDIYKFYLTYTNQYTWSTDTMLGFLPFGYEMITNTTFSGFTTNGDVRTSPTLSSLLPFEHYSDFIIPNSSSTFTQVNQPIVSSEIITGSLSSNEISTPQMISSNINADVVNVSSFINTFTLSAISSIHALNCAGAYVFDGTVNFYSMPIPVICSVKNLEGALFRKINWGILFPKHRMRFFIFVADYNNNWTPANSSWVIDVDNLTDNPISFTLPSPIFDNTVAWRLFRYVNNSWSEITITGLS